MFAFTSRGKIKRKVEAALADDILTDEEIKEILEEAEDRKVSPDFIQTLREKHYRKKLQPIVKKIESTRRFSDEDKNRIEQLSKALKVTPQLEGFTPYRKLWEIEKSGTFEPEPIEVSIRLVKNEVCYYEAPATWAQMKKVRTNHGYTGSSVGFRVAKGVTFRVGRAKPIVSESEEIVPISDGVIYITNKKILFHGTKRSTNITFGRLIDHVIYKDAIEIVKSSGKPDVFYMTPLALEFTDALLQVLE